MNYDTPSHRSPWRPADLDFAAKPSGKGLLDIETGEVIALTYGQLYGLTVDLAESAAAKAEEALIRTAGRTMDLTTEPDGNEEIDLSYAADTSDAALLARWDSER